MSAEIWLYECLQYRGRRDRDELHALHKLRQAGKLGEFISTANCRTGGREFSYSNLLHDNRR